MDRIASETPASEAARPETDGSGEPLIWTFHPIRRRPARGLLLLAVCVWVGFSVAVRWAMPALSVVAVLVLLLAASPFLLPTRFHLDARGVRIRFLWTERHRPWTDLKRWREAEEGVLLTPMRRRSVLDETRGLFLRFDDDGPGRREAVMAVVRRRLPPRSAGTADG